MMRVCAVVRGDQMMAFPSGGARLSKSPNKGDAMKTHAMTALLAATALTTTLTTSCARPDFRQALPKKATVQMNVPQSTGQALTAGDPSNMYLFTLGTSVSINVAVLGVFATLVAVTRTEPTESDDQHAVWGPSEPKGLEPLSHKLTVERVGDDRFRYQLEARKKNSSDDADWVVVLEGESQPGDDNDGTGSMTWHLGSQRNLIVEDCALVGDITATYDASTQPRELDVVFEQVADECKGETPHDAHYVYTESADGAGSMDFAIKANIHQQNENKPEEEVLAVRSRWLADGTGRSDVQVSGGEVDDDLADLQLDADSVDLVECWDASFIVSHTDTAPDALEPYLDHAPSGDAALCPFDEAEFASL
jgi:hypothetical protein